MKKAGVILIIMLILAGSGYFLFLSLGGNAKIEISLEENSPSTLTGKTYVGTPQDPKLGETFQEIEALQALHPGSKIHTLYYVEPAGKLDTMKVFVGIDLAFPTSDLESLSFSESKYILAKIKGNKWLMPGPEKVKSEIVDFAQKKGLILSGVYVDRIVTESEIQVIAPVR